MAWLSAFLRKHWIAVVVLTTVALLSGLAQIWGVFTHDTIPDFIAKRGWSLTMPNLTGFGPYFLTGLLVVLQVALVSLLIKTRNLPTAEPDDKPSGAPVYEIAPVEQLTATKKALEKDQRERERLRGLLGNEQETLKQCRSDLACTRLKILGRDSPNKRMTVRYLDFSDNQFAEYVATTIRRHTGWSAIPVRDASSHLIQETEWRVVFSSGDQEIVKRLRELFIQGNLVGEPVSAQEILDKPSDDPEVIVTIFPKSVV